MRKRCLIALLILFAVVALVCVLGLQHAKRRAETNACRKNLSSIGMAARLWARDHANHLPPDLVLMSNELVSPRILICPGDYSRRPAASWASFTTVQSSFEVVTPGLLVDDTNGVFLRCKIHGTLGYADTSVRSQTQ
jgi:hypothetical protein